jgi:hypothetical protein
MLRDWITCPQCKSGQVDVIVDGKLTAEGAKFDLLFGCSACHRLEPLQMSLDSGPEAARPKVVPRKTPAVIRNTPDETVAADFLSALREGLEQRAFHALRPDGGTPEDFARWGIAVVGKNGSMAFERRGPVIGWVQGDTFFLKTAKSPEDSAIGYANVFLRSTGRAPLPYAVGQIRTALINTKVRTSAKTEVVNTRDHPDDKQGAYAAAWAIPVETFFSYGVKTAATEATFEKNAEAVGRFFAGRKGA